MARPTLNEDCKVFLVSLRKKAKPVGNGALRKELGWAETRYWKVHESLIEAGRIMRGRGRGGSVSKA